MTKSGSGKNVHQTFDLLNRMTGWTDGQSQATYDYYTNNMRRSKTVNGETTLHIWVGDEIAADITGSKTVSYLQGYKLISSDYGYYMYNAHGDVVQLLDSESNVIHSYDYDAFGIVKKSSEEDTNPYRYAGEYTDLESGYNYLRARYYDPEVGRFVSADSHWNVGNMLYGDDPIKFGGIYVPDIASIIQSGNLYVYAINNPMLYTDPDGEIAMIATMLIGAAAGAVIGGGIDMIGQLMSGKSFEELDWKSIGISAGSGAISGAISGSGIGKLGAAIANGVLSGTTIAAKQMAKGEKINWKSVAVDSVAGGVAGFIGGSGVRHGTTASYTEIDFMLPNYIHCTTTTYKTAAAFTVKKELRKSLLKLIITTGCMAIKDYPKHKHITHRKVKGKKG